MLKCVQVIYVKEHVKSITLKVSENTMDKMKKYFEEKKREKTPPYAVFQADEADTVVTLYQTGKALFQGISADIDANMWSEVEKNLNPDKKIQIKTTNDKKKQKNNSFVYFHNTIGSDEVGTGDYFGPIVVTASYVKKEDIPFLENLKVKDSKKMTDEDILKITPQIIKRIPYYTMILSNKEYNEKHKKVNLNAMKAILHNKALLEISKKYNDYDYIVVDQFAEKPIYYHYLKEVPNVQRNITFITKAEDQCLSVACSAIISRYVFLKQFDKMSKELGFTLPKGAGEKVDKIGAEIVKKYGINILNEISKISFKNTEKIKQLVSR